MKISWRLKLNLYSNIEGSKVSITGSKDINLIEASSELQELKAILSRFVIDSNLEIIDID